MAKYKDSSKGKTIFWSIVGFIGVAALVFIIVSLVMMGVHGNTLIAEWQSWFGIKAAAVAGAGEAGQTIVEGAKAILKI